MQYLTNNDSFLGSRFRVRINKVKLPIEYIDNEAASKNTKPKSGMTLAVANICFGVGRLGINIPNTTPSGRGGRSDF